MVVVGVVVELVVEQVVEQVVEVVVKKLVGGSEKFTRFCRFTDALTLEKAGV